MNAEHARHVARRVPWRQMVGGVVLCAPLLIAGAHRSDSTSELLPIVRIAALTLAAASVFALADPAALLTAATPPGRLRLRAAVASLTLVAVGCVWSGLMWLTGMFTENSLWTIVPGSSVELLAMFAVGLVIAAEMEHATSLRLAPTWAAAALVLTFAATLTNARTREWLWIEPGPDWRRAHVRWLLLAAVGFTAFVWSSRDPARRSPRLGVNRIRNPARLRHKASA